MPRSLTAIVLFMFCAALVLADDAAGLSPEETQQGFVSIFNGKDLDDEHPRWKNLKPYQYHGSIYGVVPCKRGHLKPAGVWNSQEIMADGGRVRVTLNGQVIVDADISKIDPNKTIHGRPHPGLHNKKGHIGFLGHGARLEFRNLRIKEL